MRRIAIGMAGVTLAALALAGPVAAAPAGPGVVLGEVRADSTRAALPGAEVVVRRAADSTVVAHGVTAADGRFRLEGLPLDRYLFRASLLGYRPIARQDVVLTGAAPVADLGVLALAISPIAVPGTAVTTERPTVIIAPDRNIYLTKDMPAASSGMATDVLRAVPELDVDIAGNVSLRGSSSVTIQFNGRAAPMRGEGLTAYLRQLPANRIERIEVVANPSAKYDPEGTAGIVNLVLKDNVDLGLSGNLYLGGSNRSSFSAGRLAYQRGKLTFFGGITGGLNHYSSGYDDFRTNLLASPLSFYRANSASDSRSGYGVGDGSVELSLDKRSTLYSSFSGYRSSSDTQGDAAYAVLDPSSNPTSLYDRANDGGGNWSNASATMGFRHVAKASTDEWTVELQQNGSGGGSDSRSTRHDLVPTGSADELSRTLYANGSRDRSVQFDDTHPLGEHGKLESGYRALSRRLTNTTELEFFDGDTLVVTPLSARSEYAHREDFQTGYLTLGSVFGKLSAQLGVRAEAANTELDVRSARARYDNDYRSVFPSANVAYDFGGGRSLRFTYSKRIERPSAWYLNPESPSVDTLSRFSGNPHLSPKYTHSFSLAATWNGSRGSLMFSPYYRETIHNWDQFKQVDSNGVSLTTWRNAASVRFYGVSLTASLRQTKVLGGSVNVSGFEERHDASNLQGSDFHTAFRFSGSTNVSVKATPTLDLQGSLRYTPAQSLAQGRTAAVTYLNLSARLKVRNQAWLNLWLNDPFDLYRYRYSTRDETHAQTSTSTYSSRTALLSLNWAFGKPPEQKAKPHTTEEQQQQPEPGGTMH